MYVTSGDCYKTNQLNAVFNSDIILNNEIKKAGRCSK